MARARTMAAITTGDSVGSTGAARSPVTSATAAKNSEKPTPVVTSLRRTTAVSGSPRGAAGACATGATDGGGTLGATETVGRGEGAGGGGEERAGATGGGTNEA